MYYFTPAHSEHVPDPAGIQRAVPALLDRSRWTWWRQRNFDFLQAEIQKLPRGLAMADLGAGLSVLRELYEGFALVVPIDFYPFELVTVVADLNHEIPLKDATVDVLLLSEVLEHIAEPVRLLAECRRVLKPGGVLLGTVPFTLGVHMRPYDYYRFTDIGLTYLLGNAGFADTQVIPVVTDLDRARFMESAEQLFTGLIGHHAHRGGAGRLTALALKAYFRVLAFIVFKMSRALGTLSGSPDEPLGYHFSARA